MEQVPTFARPAFLDGRRRAWVQQATALVHSAMAKVVRAHFHHGLFEDWVQMHPRAAELARTDAHRDVPMVSTRYDVVLDPDSDMLQFLECQAGDPSGMGWHDALVGSLQALAAMQSLERDFEMSATKLAPSHLLAVTREHRAFCEAAGRPCELRPNIAFLCARESTLIRTDLRLLVNTYREQGFDAVLCDPRELTLEGDTLYAGDLPLSIVVRDTIDELVLEPFWDEVQPLIEAHRKRQVLVLNPFCAMAADDKTLFEVLSDEAHAHLFSPEERAALDAHVPVTRRLFERRTTVDGAERDLLPWVRRHKDGFVLKPADGYGGFGIVIGAELATADWDKAVDAALKSERKYVVQEYVPLPSEPFPTFTDRGFQGLENRRVVSSLWWHGNQFAGCFARAASDRVVNVHQGGGLVPIFLVQPRRRDGAACYPA
jgi:hypothetical protein